MAPSPSEGSGRSTEPLRLPPPAFRLRLEFDRLLRPGFLGGPMGGLRSRQLLARWWLAVKPSGSDMSRLRGSLTEAAVVMRLTGEAAVNNLAQFLQRF